MDDEKDAFRTSTRFVEYADEDAVKEANEEFKKRFSKTDDDDDEDEEEIDLDGNKTQQEEGEKSGDQQGDEDEEDILDKLTGNVDDEDDK